MFTTSGIYPWSFVTQIFHSGQPSYDMFEVISLGSLASLLAGTLYNRIPDILRDIYSICRCCWNVATYKWNSQRENLNNIFCRKVSFLIAPHCQIRCVGQGMKQAYMYPSYLLIAEREIERSG